jgi:predicted nucleic acid-binding protein
MSGNRFLLDTNIILYILRGNTGLVDLLNGNDLYISVITEMELLSYGDITEAERKQIQDLIQDIEVIHFDDDIKELAIAYRVTYRLKLPDAIIAASASIHNLVLVSADKKLQNITDLKVLSYRVS